MEIWKDIPEFEGRYQASNYGKIKSLEREEERKGPLCGRGSSKIRKVKEIILKTRIVSGKGYLIVNMGKNGIKYTKKVHRVIISAFIGISDLQVNHKNGIKTDNNINNLEYVSGSENMLHAYKTGLKIPKHKLTEIQVKEIKEKLINYKRGMFKDLGKEYNIDRQTIADIYYNKTWK